MSKLFGSYTIGKQPAIHLFLHYPLIALLAGGAGLGFLNFMLFKERFTAQVFLEFLRRLVRQSARRVYLAGAAPVVHLRRFYINDMD